MSFQPLGGICWGLSAVRPRWLSVTVSGPVSWPADRPSPAAAPSPCGADPCDPPALVPWASLALRPLSAVLRPTNTAVASMPSRTVRLAARPNRPGRCRVLPATFAIAALPARPVRVHGYPPKTNRTLGPFVVLGRHSGRRRPSQVTTPTCPTGIAPRHRPAPQPGRDQQRRHTLDPKSSEAAVQGCVLRPLCAGDARPRPRSEETMVECCRRSVPVWWAWLDLNQRPHPYQLNAGNRCAHRR